MPPKIVDPKNLPIERPQQLWRKEPPELGPVFDVRGDPIIDHRTGRHLEKVVRGGFLEHQLEWWELQNFIKGLVAGYGSGKTNILCKRAASVTLLNAPAPTAMVSPTYRMARDTIVETLQRLLAGKATILKDFEWRYWKGANIFTMRHGRRSNHIKVYSGEDPTKLRGPNLGAAYIDEPFLQDQAVFDQMIARVRHPAAILKEIGLSGCVTRDTLVVGTSGLKTIGSYDPGPPFESKQYRPLSVAVYGLDRKFHEATKFFDNGRAKTVQVTVRGGYKLEATLDHPVWVMGDGGVPEWRPVGKLREGDWVAIGRGMEVWGDYDPCRGFTPPRRRKNRRPLPDDVRMTTDLAYFFGLWLAEGSIEPGRVTITCGDKSVRRSLTTEGVLGLRFKAAGKWQSRVSSIELVALMRHVGMPLVKAPKKHVPEWVFRGRREWALAFLAGMYDGDGCVHKSGSLQYSSSSERMLKDLQCLLLNLGIVSKYGFGKHGATERCRPGYGGALHVTNNNAARLARELPLRIKRKRDRLRTETKRDSDPVPHQGQLLLEAWGLRRKLRWRKGEANLDSNIVVRCARLGSGRLAYGTLRDFLAKWDANETHEPKAIKELRKTVSDWYWWGPVKKLKRGEAETVDFVVPDTHSFWSNGFISHNTPESLNWGYDLFAGELKDRHDTGYVQASTYDNYVVGEEYAKRLEGSFTDKAADAYIHGAFVNLAKGMVYYGFKALKGPGCNVQDLGIPDGAELWAGMDFNVNPMAFCVGWHDERTNHMHVMYEYELPNADTEYACSLLRQQFVAPDDKRKPDEQRRKLPDRFVLKEVFPDPTGRSRHTNAPAGRTDFHYIQEAGFEIRAHSEPGKPGQRDAENAVNGKFAPKVGPPTLTVAPRCKRLIKYLSVYSHELKNKPEQRAYSHLLDSLKYSVELLYPVSRERITEMRLTGY